MPVTYDGNSIFGYAVRIRPETAESASQQNEFFGVDGIQRLYGGGRGRMFEIEGVLVDSYYFPLATQIATIEGYDDGIGRTLYDPITGRSWDSVIFRLFRQKDRILPGPAIQYTATFEGLI